MQNDPFTPDPWWRKEYPRPHWCFFEDFRYFLWLVWKHLGLPEPTPVQYQIAAYLQYGPRRLMIEAFRGIGKSWIASAYVCWQLLRNPLLKFLVVSASKPRADNFSTFTLDLISEMPLLQHLAPREGQRSSKTAFDVAPATPDHAPSVRSVGILGQLAGSRAHEVLGDDIEIPNNSETPVQRAKLEERSKEFDAIILPGGKIKYLGTPQTEDSTYTGLPDRGYTIRIWPALAPTLAEADRLYQGRVCPSIMDSVRDGLLTPGAPTEPSRFPMADLMERKLSYGRAGFALQFLLDTTLSDAQRYPLRCSDLIVADIDPERGPTWVQWTSDPRMAAGDLPCVGMNGDGWFRPWETSSDRQPYLGSRMFVDPSGRGKDETGYAVLKSLNSYLFCTALGGFRDGYSPETLEALAQTAKDNDVQMIHVEPNFGGGMFVELFRPVLRRVHPKCGLMDAEWARGPKEKRIIDTLEPIMARHRLVVDPKVIRDDFDSVRDLPTEKQQLYRAFYQLTRITADKGALAHDDRIEALAGAAAMWGQAMALDEKTREKKRKEDLFFLECKKSAGSTVASLEQLIRFGGDPEALRRAIRQNPEGGPAPSRLHRAPRPATPRRAQARSPVTFRTPRRPPDGDR